MKIKIEIDESLAEEEIIIYYVIFHWETFADHPMQVFK